MIEHWQALAAGVLFCMPACIVIAMMAWRRRIMADITMCHGNDCPLKTKCYSYTAYANQYWQSIFTEIHYKDGKCKHYWDNKGKRNRPDGEPMFKERGEDDRE